MKFSLITNSQEKDVFKLVFDASNKEELEICRVLSEKVIEKITKIEVKVSEEIE